MLNELSLGCGKGESERAELKNQIDVGSSVSPESPSMRVGGGKALLLKVAGSQNG